MTEVTRSGSVTDHRGFVRPLDQSAVSRHSANASLTVQLASEKLRRRAHRHAGSLQTDHVKGRSLPQFSATSPRPKNAPTTTEVVANRFCHCPRLVFVCGKKRSGYEEPAVSIPARSSELLPLASTVSQRPALVSPLGFRSVNPLPRFPLPSPNSRVLLLLLDARLRPRRFSALRFALEARPNGLLPHFLPPIRAREPSSSFVCSDSVRGPSSLDRSSRVSSRSSPPSLIFLRACDRSIFTREEPQEPGGLCFPAKARS